MTVKYEKFLLNGVEYKTQLTQKWVNRKKWEEPNPYLLTSHIPGTIMQIEVKEGQEVQEGERAELDGHHVERHQKGDAAAER